MNESEKGVLSESKVTAKLMEMGYTVSTPWGKPKYDLIVDLGNQLQKVQVKTAHRRCREGRSGEYAAVTLHSSTRRAGGVEKVKYESSDVDAFAIYYPKEDEVYWLWFDEAPSSDTKRTLSSWREHLIDEKI